MSDTEILDGLEAQLQDRPGGCLSPINGWRISRFPDGFHVAKSSADDPIIDQCSLREALKIALTTKPV